MTKPTVQYKDDPFSMILIGRPAYIHPIDHPSDLVSNEGMVKTSRVVSYDPETGSFETVNTKYVLEQT